jgi:hypothetical protein
MECTKIQCYFAWASNAAAESSGPVVTLEQIRELVKVGIDQVDRGEYVTSKKLRENLGLP